MAIKSFLSLQNLTSYIFVLFFISGCANISTRRSAPVDDSTLGPTAEMTSEPAPEDHSEARSGEGSLPKLGLVLGPGGVKAFAHTGVLKQLHKANIPVHSLVGLEWGALVAALYAKKPKINDVDWRLYKLQAKTFVDSSIFSKSIPQRTMKVFRPFLNENFGQSQVGQTKLPFACPSLSIWTGRIIWQRSGSMKRAIERCLPYPPLFKPEGPWMAASFQAQQAVEFLLKQGADVIVFVNVLGRGEILPKKVLSAEFQSAILWQELRRELEKVKSERLVVVDVNTSRYPLYDFKNRNSLVLAGERAGRQAVEELIGKFGF